MSNIIFLTLKTKGRKEGEGRGMAVQLQNLLVVIQDNSKSGRRRKGKKIQWGTHEKVISKHYCGEAMYEKRKRGSTLLTFDNVREVGGGRDKDPFLK